MKICSLLLNEVKATKDSDENELDIVGSLYTGHIIKPALKCQLDLMQFFTNDRPSFMRMEKISILLIQTFLTYPGTDKFYR